MQLISLNFALFWIIALILYYLFPKYQAQVLLILSLVCFYLFSAGLPLLILIAAAVAYCYGLLSEKRKGRVPLIVTVLVLVALLVLFRHVLTGEGDLLSFLLPALGLSYYLLSALSYCFEVYRGEILPEKNYFRLLLFLCYFPALLQGPINRFKDLSKELTARHTFSYQTFTFGVQRAMFGVMKKLVIVPRLLQYTDVVYQDISEAGLYRFLLGSLFFSIGLYLDWTGYMDIILGISETFGIRLPENFRQPYFSASPSEFWKRWHFSLGQWFRDNVYIPMGGSRNGLPRQLLALFTVWVLTGIWHGAKGGYLLWGLWHAAVLMIAVLLKKSRPDRHLHKVPAVIGTILIACIGWIPFRLQTFTGVRELGSAMLHGSFYLFRTDELLLRTVYLWQDAVILGVALLLVLVISILHEKGRSIREMICRLPLPVRWILWLGLFFSVILFGVYGTDYDANSFIYMLF